jgi:hypothetical protein
MVLLIAPAASDVIVGSFVMTLVVHEPALSVTE